MFYKFLKLCGRTFFGVGYFLESEFMNKFTKWWFRQVEWAVIAAAILGVSLKYNNPYIGTLGLFSLMILFINHINEKDDLFESFKKSVDKANEKHTKFDMLTYSRTSTTIGFLIILVSLDLLLGSAIYYGIVLISHSKYN